MTPDPKIAVSTEQQKKSQSALAAEAAAAGTSNPAPNHFSLPNKWTIPEIHQVLSFIVNKEESIENLVSSLDRSEFSIRDKMFRVGMLLFRSAYRLHLNNNKISIICGLHLNEFSKFKRTEKAKKIHGNISLAREILKIEAPMKNSKILKNKIEIEQNLKKLPKASKIPRVPKESGPEQQIAKQKKSLLKNQKEKENEIQPKQPKQQKQIQPKQPKQQKQIQPKQPKEPKQLKQPKIQKQKVVGASKKRWTDEEFDNLHFESDKMLPIEEIAQIHGRTVKAVQRQIVIINPNVSQFYLNE